MIQPDFFKTAVKSDKIVFGPSLMELGWEIMRWSGYIRWFKKEYPKKEVIVVTRDDRKDLY